MSPLGTVTRTCDGGNVLHYERDLDVAPARAWSAITDPAILKNWLGVVETDLRVGGKFVIRFKDGNVMEGVIRILTPERLLEYSWREIGDSPESIVRWQIHSRRGGCRLTLTHTLPGGCKASDVIGFGGGWHAFLDGMEYALQGRDGIAVAYAAEAWPPLEAAYTAMFDKAPRLAIDGTLREDAGELLVRFERWLDSPPMKVWAALTEPELLARWLGDTDIDPKVGGRYTIQWSSPMTGTITMFEPERVLEYTWFEKSVNLPASRVRWELSPAQGGCRLVLTHRSVKDADRGEAMGFLGGWEQLLDILPQAASGHRTEPRPYEAYDAEYRAKYG